MKTVKKNSNLEFDLYALAETLFNDYHVATVSLHETKPGGIYNERYILICEAIDPQGKAWEKNNQLLLLGMDKENGKWIAGRVIVKDLYDPLPKGVLSKEHFFACNDKHWERVRWLRIDELIKKAGPGIRNLRKTTYALVPKDRWKDSRALCRKAKKQVREHSLAYPIIQEEDVSDRSLFEFSKKNKPQYFLNDILHKIIHRHGLGPIKKKECEERHDSIFGKKATDNETAETQHDTLKKQFTAARLLWLVDDSPKLAYNLFTQDQLNDDLEKHAESAAAKYNRLVQNGRDPEGAYTAVLAAIAPQTNTPPPEPELLSTETKAKILEAAGFPVSW